MAREEFDRPYQQDRQSDDVYSRSVKAGKRTYFFDVKSTRDSSDYYLTITESRKRMEKDGTFSFDKHKIFLYKEDFEKFREALCEVIGHVEENYLSQMPEYRRGYRDEEPEGDSF